MPTYKSFGGFVMSVNLIENPFKRKLVMILNKLKNNSEIYV